MEKFLNLKGDLVSCSNPLIMGILNITPDSFFDGGKHNSIDKAKERINQMLTEGVDIIDIGAMSSRPGAEIISEDEEWNRLEPILNMICKYYPNLKFSVDTFRSNIAEKSYCDFGASIINDISGGELDKNMLTVIARHNIPYILMHLRGNPLTMQKMTNYDDIIKELNLFFSKKINELNKLGVNDIIIDPGFGFAKTIEQNYFLLNNLDKLLIHNTPILVGLSRKSMAWKYLKINPSESLYASQSLNTIALLKGANILRVHDISPTKQLVDIYKKLNHKL
jgi:dihydropteroate synthase